MAKLGNSLSGFSLTYATGVAAMAVLTCSLPGFTDLSLISSPQFLESTCNSGSGMKIVMNCFVNQSRNAYPWFGLMEKRTNEEIQQLIFILEQIGLICESLNIFCAIYFQLSTPYLEFISLYAIFVDRFMKRNLLS